MSKSNKTAPLLGAGAIAVGAGIAAKELWGMRKVKCPVCDEKLQASQIRKCKVCKKHGCPNCVDYMHRFIENGIEQYFDNHTQFCDFSGILIKILNNKLKLYGEYCNTHANQAIQTKTEISIEAILDKFFADFDRIKIYENKTNLNIVVDALAKEIHQNELAYTSLKVKRIAGEFDLKSLSSEEGAMKQIVKKDKSFTLLDAIIYAKFFASFHGYDVIFDFSYQGKAVNAKFGRFKKA